VKWTERSDGTVVAIKIKREGGKEEREHEMGSGSEVDGRGKERSRGGRGGGGGPGENKKRGSCVVSLGETSQGKPKGE